MIERFQEIEEFTCFCESARLLLYFMNFSEYIYLSRHTHHTYNHPRLTKWFFFFLWNDPAALNTLQGKGLVNAVLNQIFLKLKGFFQETIILWRNLYCIIKAMLLKGNVLAVLITEASYTWMRSWFYIQTKLHKL